MVGRASLLLRLRVYREGDTHTPAQRHAGIQLHTNIKWLVLKLGDSCVSEPRSH